MTVKDVIGVLAIFLWAAPSHSAAGQADPSRKAVYALAEEVQLRPEPRLGSGSGTTAKVSFGQKMLVSEETGDWLSVQVSGQDLHGWVHRAAITSSEFLPRQMAEIGLRPKAILFISGIRGSGTFAVSIVEGGVRLGTKRLVVEHGTCVVTAEKDAANQAGGISMKGLGVEQTLSSPEPWTLYFYCSSSSTFRSISSLIADRNPVVAAPPRPKEEPVIEIEKPVQKVAKQSNASEWPKFSMALVGRNPVRVKNPNAYSAKVALRSGDQGKDFAVAANDSNTVYVPDGRYDIYFQYSDDPGGLYQGDSFTLNGNGVEIQLVKVVGGNYRIRRIR